MRLTPSPESDLTLSVFALGAWVLSRLHARRKPMFLEDLLSDFLADDKRRNHSMFFDALTFLYTIGAVEASGRRIKMSDYGSTEPHLF